MPYYQITTDLVLYVEESDIEKVRILIEDALLEVTEQLSGQLAGNISVQFTTEEELAAELEEVLDEKEQTAAIQ